MVLTKDELLASLQNEVRLLLHLASKVDATSADYRPTPKQRSTLELLQYLTIMAPIHLRGVLGEKFDMEEWRKAWTMGEGAASAMRLDEAVESIGKQPAMFSKLLGELSDDDLRTEIEIFGKKSSRGSLIVNLVLCHLSAYRMQLFLYLKESGRTELNTVNLWMGVDKM